MISFIVPAYNEAANIESTIGTIRSAAAENCLQAFEIIVVDDGSTDGTGRIADALQQRIPDLSVIHHQANLGLGSAIRSGLAVARCRKFMVIPGDNDVQRGLVDLMLRFCDHADMILTVPLNREIRTLSRMTLSLIYQLIHMMAFRVFVNYINGPGIWPTEAARAIELRGQRFSIISELNIKLLRSGCSYLEVPGYFQAGPKARRTVTSRNLTEVMTSFLALLYDIRVRHRSRFSLVPRRVLVSFVDVPPAAGGMRATDKVAIR
jgi:glycosyltransferase involved in cell wall biosynthesis